MPKLKLALEASAWELVDAQTWIASPLLNIIMTEVHKNVHRIFTDLAWKFSGFYF